MLQQWSLLCYVVMLHCGVATMELAMLWHYNDGQRCANVALKHIFLFIYISRYTAQERELGFA
jgi:hypothetical protein